MSTGSGLVIVAGGTSGIGLAVAEEAGRRGFDVLLLGRDEQATQTAALRVKGLGAQCHTAVCDLTRHEQVDDVVRMHAQDREVIAWIHCAGTMTYGEVMDTPPSAFSQVLDNNLTAVFLAARAILPVFRRQGRGCFIVVGSTLGHLLTPNIAPYLSSKWGLRGLLGAIRLEQQGFPRIHIVELAPWSVDTPIFDRAPLFQVKSGRPPPPLEQASTVARAALDVIDRPPRWTRTRFVGPLARLSATLHSLSPAPVDNAMAAMWRFMGQSKHPPAASNHQHLVRISGGWVGRWIPRSILRRSPAARAHKGL